MIDMFHKPGETNLLPKDGEVLFFPRFFATSESDHYFQTLCDEIAWRQEPIFLFGKEVMQPRLTAWYGDGPYAYSGIEMPTLAWTATLEDIKRRIEKVANVRFNGALLNQYRDGNDSVSWHRDDEKELGANPVIGSVSFGATRLFQMKHRHDKDARIAVDLSHGSLLLMRGATQHHWEHCVPKRAQVTGPRINITFRVLARNGK